MATELDAMDGAGEKSSLDPERATNADCNLEAGNRPAGKVPGNTRPRPKGRCNLADANLPEKRIEILDQVLKVRRNVLVGKKAASSGTSVWVRWASSLLAQSTRLRLPKLRPSRS